MRPIQWYFPAKKFPSQDVQFDVSFRCPVVRTDDKGQYVKTYLADVLYPIVGLAKTEGAYIEGNHVTTYAVKLNDGYVIDGLTLDTFDVTAKLLGTGWTETHDLAYFANRWNAHQRQNALDTGSTTYTFGTAEKVNGRPAFIPLATLPIRPQRNEPWMQPIEKAIANADAMRHRLARDKAASDIAVIRNRQRAGLR